jgi:hypothetical protein
MCLQTEWDTELSNIIKISFSILGIWYADRAVDSGTAWRGEDT